MNDIRWVRLGGAAGVVYALVSVVAGAITGTPPTADGRSHSYQSYFVEHHASLVIQAWLFPILVPLLLMFSVAVRRLLQPLDTYASELFMACQTAVAALLVITMGLQIVVVQAAGELDAQVVYTFGVHLGAVVIVLWGFLTATAALSYVYCVFRGSVVPRWTAYIAVLTAIVCVVCTGGVFVRTGAFSVEGGFSAFAPALSTVLWYLCAGVAMMRLPARAIGE